MLVSLCVADFFGASWVGLLFVGMWRSDADLAAGPKEQLGEEEYSLQLRKGQTPLCVTQCVNGHTCKCATLHVNLS